MNPNTQHQGWTNYETWKVALHLRNDEMAYRLMSEACLELHLYDLNCLLGKQIVKNITGLGEQIITVHLYKDHIMANVDGDKINWFEIIESFSIGAIDDIKE